MKTMGLLISHKNNEKRRGLVPEHLKNIENVGQLYFEKGYGESVGYSDEEYILAGAHVVSREEAVSCDILVDVKLGDADYLDEIEPGKLLVGWAHSVQNVDFTSNMLNCGHTVLAWEEIFEDGRYIFYRNRELAGEAAIMQGFRFSGLMPYDAKVAVLGNGQVAKGAIRVLNGLGADIMVYGRRNEALFRKEMGNYDVIVNCVFWDTSRTDRLIYREDLKRLKKGALIIDVSCDPYLEIETSHPTTIDNPVYVVDGITHYAVDNTPAMFPKSVTNCLSEGYSRYVDAILTDNYPESLRKAVVIENGHILDERIAKYREARGIFCK
ncbi:MAG: N(5)-(carboxyethyl)ornithine synthase [Oscillospiraceae bacterium]|nr:N(5)-(carboxyethyl)ornithine synthase [Oscillospiraceae bacterium]